MIQHIQKITLLTMMITNLTFGHYSPEYTTYIKNRFLSGQKETPYTPIKLPESLKDIFKNLFTGYNFTVPEATNDQKIRIVFNLPTTAAVTTEPEVIDTHFVDDMELIANPQSPDNKHLTFFISHNQNNEPLIHTTLGKRRMAEITAQPTIDITLLKERQAIIRDLVQNGTLLAVCEKYLNDFKQHEGKMLSLYTENPCLQKDILRHCFWYFNFLNKSAFSIECGRILGYTGNFLSSFPIVPTTFSVCLGLSLPTYLPSYKRAYDLYQEQRFSLSNTNDMLPPYTSPVYFLKLGIENLRLDTWLRMAGFLQLLGIPGTMIAINDVKLKYAIEMATQDLMIHVAKCTKNIERLHKLLVKQKAYGNYPQSLRALNITDHTKPAVRSLVKTLRKRTFKGSPSFFSYMGRVFNAYQELEERELKFDLVASLAALGELDAYVTIAKKMLSSAPENPYCFVTFLNETVPRIKAHGLHNPFIIHPVSNDITLGDEEHGTTIILSGPNTGGKSAFTNSLVYNVLLAQTYGIAPAKDFSLTPFSAIYSHRNINDNVVIGESRFMAEVQRIKKILNTLEEKTNTTHFTLLALDELFSSTSPDQANVLTHQCIEKLTQKKNVLTIAATHFEKPLTLATTNPACRNYHMGAIVNADGLIKKYTYKLTPGISPYKSGLQIAKQEIGFA